MGAVRVIGSSLKGSLAGDKESMPSGYRLGFLNSAALRFRMT